MEIKKGERFKCIENIFSTNSSNILFTVGKEYVCDVDNTITDNLGCCYSVNNEGHLNRFFLRIPSTKAPEDTQKEEKVLHPKHYTWLKEKCGVEVIDITRHFNFDIGNALKYLFRAGHKDEEGYTTKEKQLEDLRKAIFYINDEIKQIEDGKAGSN